MSEYKPYDNHKDILNDDYLQHYGTPRHSGRYPWGSGENPYQREQNFYTDYQKMHKKGMSNTEIAEYYRNNVPGFERFSTADLTAKISIAKAHQMADRYKQIMDLKEHGYSNIKIAEMMGLSNESVVRATIKDYENSTANKLKGTVDILRENVDKKGPIDIGPGVELELGVTSTNLKTAAKMLEEEGYRIETVYVQPVNATGQNKTATTILIPKDMDWVDAQKDLGSIQTITDYSPDGGVTFNHTEYPSSIDSSRIYVRYDEDGGSQKDGVVELRRGVEDLSLGNSNYAQVRIAVDDTHYIKGMAMYSDDIPDGYDIIVNSNKHVGTPLMSDDPNGKQVLKTLKNDKEMPFGAAIKAGGQSYYADPNGDYVKITDDTYRKATSKDGDAERYSLSAVNKLQEEGDWDSWSKTLSSQFLSKQSVPLIKTQLNYTYADSKGEFDTIMSLTNPIVKQKLLDSFADDCDASAVDLKASSLPRQSSKVILPITTLPENQIYAPTYNTGEKVVLIRHPHGGVFEIPELVVNNKHEDAKKLLGNAKDAVGINAKVAEQLSGADFDGDSVIVIPVNSRVHVKTSEPLQQLKDFNPKEAYPAYEGMPKMQPKTKQLEMGKISNLITDMTIKGATTDEIARAVKHSMVVIDAEKHNLNYKQSYIDNDIAELKKKYQDGGGSSTLISKASSEKDVPERKYNWRPDPETGKITYEETGRTYTEWKKDKDGNYVKGKEKQAMEKTTWMADTDDAHTLSSGTPQEELYANYANKMKDLANKARKASMEIETPKRSDSAKKVYESEIRSLEDKLRVAELNAPRERTAQRLAAVNLKKKITETPTLKDDKDKLKKVKQKVLADARAKTNAKKALVEITDKEWEAIQNNAISSTMLRRILNNTDMDKLKDRATPRNSIGLSSAKEAKIKAMSSTGYYTIKEMADAIGVSTSTISKYLSGNK